MNPENFKAGFVAIVGLPNVGKSTLLNALIKSDLSVTTPKPQTTRNNILGILNENNLQIIFLDTPGMLGPRNLFEKSMAFQIRRAVMDDSDLICLMTEPELPPPEKLFFFDVLKKTAIPVFLLINKTDVAGGSGSSQSSRNNEPPAHQVSGALSPDLHLRPQSGCSGKIEETQKYFTTAYSIEAVFKISALRRTGLENLKKAIIEKMPANPAYYPTDQITDRWERFYAAEIIRKWIFNLYADEIPYSASVEIEMFRENKEGPDYIRANIHVSKKSHKPIIIGEKGRKIAGLRQGSEKEIERFLGRPVKLELSVKVTENWENNPSFLKNLGF
ncbi:MAG: GTPase Era [Elusimicrobia bacterium]|nr:GTPase Era [Elusimicrobiota bacterium]